MIQDIAPHVLRNEFIPHKKPGERDIVLHFNANGLLVRNTEEGTMLPRRNEVPANLKMQYILRIDDKDIYLIKADSFEMPEGWTYMGISDIRKKGHLPKYLMYAVMTAFHLAHWYRDNQFCGRCGTELVWAEDERALDCPRCGRRIYPRINPAVIVAVTNGDELLLTKYANRPFTDYALVAGFTEIGETFEGTVRREVMEETGLKVKNIRYYKSQPWGVADDILAGYYCDVDGDPTIRMDHNELKMAKWFKRDEVILQKDDLSLTNEMMLRFKMGKEPR